MATVQKRSWITMQSYVAVMFLLLGLTSSFPQKLPEPEQYHDPKPHALVAPSHQSYILSKVPFAALATMLEAHDVTPLIEITGAHNGIELMQVMSAVQLHFARFQPIITGKVSSTGREPELTFSFRREGI